jgi:hypothetical protein
MAGIVCAAWEGAIAARRQNGPSVELPWDARCVDIDLDIDIATFMISPREIEAIERVPYGGLQAQWPPPPPRVDVGITYAGFPGILAKLSCFLIGASPNLRLGLLVVGISC